MSTMTKRYWNRVIGTKTKKSGLRRPVNNAGWKMVGARELDIVAENRSLMPGVTQTVLAVRA